MEMIATSELEKIAENSKQIINRIMRIVIEIISSTPVYLPGYCQGCLGD
jgi:hypothetical protein